MCNIFRTNRSLPIIALAVGFILVTACGDTVSDEGDGHDGVIVSEQGLYEAHVTPDPAEPTTGENELMFHLMDQNGEGVEGANLGVEPWMPAHGHGSPESPIVEETGDGMYLISNVIYSMPGHWEVRIEIKDGENSARMILDYDVK